MTRLRKLVEFGWLENPIFGFELRWFMVMFGSALNKRECVIASNDESNVYVGRWMSEGSSMSIL